MNLSNEDNSLQLLKYLPDTMSHYMLQPTESLDLGQIPGLCDDLMTNGLDLGTGWTVSNLTLPILLSTPNTTETGIDGTLLESFDRPKDSVVLETTQPNIIVDKPTETMAQTQIFINNLNVASPPTTNTIVLHIPENITSPTKRKIKTVSKTKQKKIKLSKTKPKRVIKKLIGENGTIQTVAVPETNILNGQEIVEITSDSIVNLGSIENNIIITNKKTEEIPPKSIIKKIIAENGTIQKVTVPETNNYLLNTQEIIEINSDSLVNLEQLENTVERQQKNKIKKPKQKKIIKKILRKGIINDIVNISKPKNIIIGENGIQTVTVPEGNSCLLDGQEIVEICSNGIVNLERLENNIIITNPKVKEEETININDVANVITAYQCKNCEFSCNDEHLFLEHYKEVHKNNESENNKTIKHETDPNETTDVLFTLYVQEDDEQQQIIIKNEPNLTNDTNEEVLRIIKVEDDDSVVQIEEIGSEDEGVHLYICSKCGEGGFESIDAVRNHMIEVHELQSLDETQLKAETETVSVVVSADEIKKRNQMAIEKFLTTDVMKSRKNKCTVKGCQYRFAKSELLNRHVNCHVDGIKNQFRCPECNQDFQSWRVCSMHLWNCHRLDLDLYTCPLCDYRTTTPMKLTIHMKVHSDDKEFACPDCGKRFKQASQMRNHRVIHLDKELHGIPKWYAQKHCDKCGKDFADAKCLKKHVQAVHSRLKPFICNVCGHSCARKAMLEMHVRQHTGEKPYACQTCYYRTGDHNSLRRHMMRHSGERPYKCPHCSYTAIQSNSYKNHLANKHPGMAGFFTCNICNFRCVNDELFTSHLNEHEKGLIDKTGKRPPPDNQKPGPVDAVLTSDTNSSKSSEDDRPETSTIVSKRIETEDDETQHFLSSLGLREEHTVVDTGGITIPAD